MTTRRDGRLRVAAALFLVLGPALAAKLDGQAGDERAAETVAPGVEHVSIRRAAPSGPDLWSIHVLVLDPARVTLELGLALDEIVGAETTSSMAARAGALAATNGGYFRTTGLLRGEPAGLLALGREILSEPQEGRPGLAVTNAGGRTRLHAARIAWRAALKAGRGAERAVGGVNRPRGEDEIVVYTPAFHRTTLSPPGGYEASVRRGRVASVRDGPGSSPIPPDGFVVSASGAAADWARAHLAAGKRLSLRSTLEADPPLPFRPDFAIGGGPRLLAAGRPSAGEDGRYPAGFAGTRHPRTAAGVRADGTIVLAVVDGRRPGRSVGMTIAELRGLMAELGCVEAINLDGGGSTTMVVRGTVVNSPSDPAGERPVSDALLVKSRRP